MYYFSSARIINYKNSEANKIHTEQLANSFDQNLSLGLGVYNQIVMSEDVQTFIGMPGINYSNLIAVMNELQLLGGSYSHAFPSVAVGKVDCDTIITTKCTKSTYDFFASDMGISSEKGLELLETIKSKSFSYQTAVPGNINGRNVITYVMSADIVHLNRKLICYLTFDVESILPESNLSKSSTVIYDGTILYSDINSHHNTAKLEEKIEKLYNGKKIFEYSNSNSGNLTYHSMRSDWSDIMFFFITPKNLSGIEYAQIILSTLALAIILTACGILTATKITNNLYSPVKQLLSNVKTSDTLLKDEFSVIESMLSSLSDEKDKLKSSIEQKHTIFKTNILRSMLQGLDFSQHEYEHLFLTDELDWMKRDISVAIYRLTDTQKTSTDKSPEYDVSEKIHNIIFNTLIKDVNCEIVRISTANTAIIFKSDSEDDVIAQLRQIFPYIEITFNITATVAFSQITCSLQNISVPYSLAATMLDSNLANITHNNILLRSEMPDTVNSTFYYPIETETTLIDQTLNSMSRGVENVIEQILTENFDKRSLSQEQLTNLKSALFITINRIINQLPDKNIKKLYEDGLVSYHEIERQNTRQELKNTVMRMLELIMKNIDSQKKTQSTSFAADVMEYIAANYQNDIALTDVSRHFNLSASYLSMLFKNNFGENFKEYLNIYRIKKAKEIISSNNYITIKELATMVGFNNSDTFIRVFKRYEGVSPGQYQSKKFKN